ncbi:hypothetical protein GCM10009737_22860 [Nocardioides lentus]|uniref:non-specific serine/threonine protein kinase n=1 Tax=Nocardioides lentus TaxID=338077 RepID=A0ABP5ARE5_9ACTN
MEPTDLDELDGLPTWRCAEGRPLVPGLVALERLGVGHRTETWLAWSLELWHPAIVKLARPHQVSHPRAARSMRREARALRCGHPALPRLLDDHTGAPLPHVVLEYVDGEPFADVVDEGGALPPADVAMLAARLAPPLLHLHRTGLAHLDVKSENVLLREGCPVLVDFGSSREIGRRQPAGRPVGTPGYAAPDQEACRPVSAAMDYFGLGTVLAEALTGRPFPEVTALPATPVTPLVRVLLDPDPERRGSPDALLRGAAAACREAPWPSCLGRGRERDRVV